MEGGGCLIFLSWLVLWCTNCGSREVAPEDESFRKWGRALPMSLHKLYPKSMVHAAAWLLPEPCRTDSHHCHWTQLWDILSLRISLYILPDQLLAASSGVELKIGKNIYRHTEVNAYLLPSPLSGPFVHTCYRIPHGLSVPQGHPLSYCIFSRKHFQPQQLLAHFLHVLEQGPPVPVWHSLVLGWVFFSGLFLSLKKKKHEERCEA